MLIYEANKSVFLKYSRRETPYLTYICVHETPEEVPVEIAFDEMCDMLKSKGLVFKNINRDKFTIQMSNNDEYSLAFAETNNGKKLVNLLRYMFSRIFTIEALYIDEDGEIVDLTNRSKHDIDH